MSSRDDNNITENDLRISNKRYFFSPFSIGPLLLEKELVAHNIKFTKNYVSTRQVSVVYTFFEKDIEFVDSVLNKIGKKSIDYDEKQRKKKKLTPESRQKKIAIYILILIFIVVLISIFS
jgi:isochorismate hydrolase